MTRIKSPEEFNALCTKREAEGVYETPGCERSVTVRPHGIFIKSKDRATGEVSLSFLRKLPKMPGELLEKILDYFGEDFLKEAAVRICFDEKNESYFFVKAGGTAGKTFIHYDYSDSLEEILRDGVICVMDVHSHNCMRAFWSRVDDADELLAPGALFGVIGGLGEKPQILCRATCRGSSVSVDSESLFEDAEAVAESWYRKRSPRPQKQSAPLEQNVVLAWCP